MANQTTPGPWESTKNGTVTAGGKIVAMVYGANQKTWEANTRSVAQVPRMIKALKLVADIYPDNDCLADVYETLDILQQNPTGKP